MAFPTETVYGLAADATNAVAVARIFAIKARPSFDPLIVHIDSAELLAQVAAMVPPAAATLVHRFWPGPLTIVLRKTETIPDIVTAGLSSVAVRMPDHAVARSLIAAAGRPLAAPSANPFGYVSPTTAAHVEAQPGPSCRSSSTADRAGSAWSRPSSPSSTPNRRCCAPAAWHWKTSSTSSARCASPPTRRCQSHPASSRHYAPRTPIVIVGTPGQVATASRRDTALLLPQPDPDSGGFAHVEVLSADGALPTVAANLFAALRRIDGGGFARIVAVAVPEAGLGRAIMDRLRRASARSSFNSGIAEP